MDTSAVIEWLLQSDEPWTRYRTMLDLLGKDEVDKEVISARAEMVNHPQIQSLIQGIAGWSEKPIRRHNDASHPLYQLSTLADFGLKASDPGIGDCLEKILNHQSPEGAFTSLVNISQTFGGTGKDQWSWILCDTPTLLYVLLKMGYPGNYRIYVGIQHLISLVSENGWRCVAAPELGKFRGPGRKTDPCPIANVYALKALALTPDTMDTSAIRAGAEMLLQHWQNRSNLKYYMFGIGTNFVQLKYPFIWYDLLHVMEVLSQYPFIYSYICFQDMIQVLAFQADNQDRYTASSMYQAWKGWSFADKKKSSPWLTFSVLRILKRVGFEGSL